MDDNVKISDLKSGQYSVEINLRGCLRQQEQLEKIKKKRLKIYRFLNAP